MDFHLDDDQQALQETVSAFCASRWPIDGFAERAKGAFDRGAWDEFVALGIPGILAPEASGGLGLGCVEAAIVFEQLGRHLVPGPLLWSVLAAPLVPEVARGSAIATGLDARATAPHFVEHLRSADLVLVLRADTVALLECGALESTPVAEPFDPLAPTDRLHDRRDGLQTGRPTGLSNDPPSDLPHGRPIGGPAEALQLDRVGTLLAASLQLGIAQSTLDVAVAYALERKQFDVPIGSFQALKHIMSDMYVRIGLARSATYAAAAVLDDPAVGHGVRSLAGAKLLAGEAAVENAKAAIQILGGMGFTWEMAPHFFLKRALALDYAFGTPRRQALVFSESLAEDRLA